MPNSYAKTDKKIKSRFAEAYYNEYGYFLQDKNLLQGNFLSAAGQIDRQVPFRLILWLAAIGMFKISRPACSLTGGGTSFNCDARSQNLTPQGRPTGICPTEA